MPAMVRCSSAFAGYGRKDPDMLEAKHSGRKTNSACGFRDSSIFSSSKSKFIKRHMKKPVIVTQISSSRPFGKYKDLLWNRGSGANNLDREHGTENKVSAAVLYSDELTASHGGLSRGHTVGPGVSDPATQATILPETGAIRKHGPKHCWTATNNSHDTNKVGSPSHRIR